MVTVAIHFALLTFNLLCAIDAKRVTVGVEATGMFDLSVGVDNRETTHMSDAQDMAGRVSLDSSDAHSELGMDDEGELGRNDTLNGVETGVKTDVYVAKMTRKGDLDGFLEKLKEDGEAMKQETWYLRDAAGGRVRKHVWKSLKVEQCMSTKRAYVRYTEVRCKYDEYDDAPYYEKNWAAVHKRMDGFKNFAAFRDSGAVMQIDLNDQVKQVWAYNKEKWCFPYAGTKSSPIPYDERMLFYAGEDEVCYHEMPPINKCSQWSKVEELRISEC